MGPGKRATAVESRRIAARRCVQPAGTGGGQHGKGRGLDHGAVGGMYVGHFLLQGGVAAGAEQRFEARQRVDGVLVAGGGHGGPSQKKLLKP